jgi:hypothetical protein
MASLYRNFEFPDLSKSVRHYDEWHATGEKDAIEPWGRMLRTHNLCNDRAPLQKLLYIYRHPFDCLKSEWHLKPRKQSMEQYIISRLPYWKRHVDSYLSRGVYSVSYEQLLGEFESTLDGIRDRFKLQPQSDRYTAVEELVGWTPSAGTRSPSIAATSATKAEMVNVLGKQFLEYTF